MQKIHRCSVIVTISQSDSAHTFSPQLNYQPSLSGRDDDTTRFASVFGSNPLFRGDLVKFILPLAGAIEAFRTKTITQVFPRQGQLALPTPQSGFRRRDQLQHSVVARCHGYTKSAAR